MKLQVAEVNTEAEELIPPNKKDSSGIGINYADAYIKVMNGSLEDGRTVACKRKGLKIMLTLGDAKGEALMRRDNGPDVKNILSKTLEEAASLDLDQLYMELEKLPDQKVHCARLALKALHKAREGYQEKKARRDTKAAS